jgi:hypothetical protein
MKKRKREHYDLNLFFTFFSYKSLKQFSNLDIYFCPFLQNVWEIQIFFLRNPEIIIIKIYNIYSIYIRVKKTSFVNIPKIEMLFRCVIDNIINPTKPH